jgi:hypothetical protein
MRTSALASVCLSFFLFMLVLPAEAQKGFESKDRYMEYLESGGVYADVCTATPRTFAELVGFLICMMNSIVPILIGAALILFFWGIVRYIFAAGHDGKGNGRKLIIWGVITLFVMVSIYGILQILMNSFGV